MCKNVEIQIHFAGDVVREAGVEDDIRKTLKTYFGLFPFDPREEFSTIRFRVLSLARGGEHQTLVKYAPGLTGFITTTGIPAKVRTRDAESVTGHFFIQKNQRRFIKVLQEGPPEKDPKIRMLRKEVGNRKKEIQSLAEERGRLQKSLITIERRIAQLDATIETNNRKNEEAEQEIRFLTEAEFASVL